MRSLIIFFAFVFVLPVLGVAQNIKMSLIHDDLEREFYVHLPENYSETKTYPLVIALHGGGGVAKHFNRSTRSRFNKLSDEKGFIVVYPQGIGKSWNDHPEREKRGEARRRNIDDVGFISAMIDQLAATYSVNLQNVFSCGISNGGLMSQTLAAELPEKIHAIGMVSANFSEIKTAEMDSISPFSMIIIHGTEDPIFPYEEGEISLLRQKRGAVIGAEKSMLFMCELNGNATDGIETLLEDLNQKDNCTSTRIVYPNEKNPSLKLELVRIEGGGHTWPGGTQYLGKRLIGRVSRDQNACDLLWDFFERTMIEN